MPPNQPSGRLPPRVFLAIGGSQQAALTPRPCALPIPGTEAACLPSPLPAPEEPPVLC